MLFIRQFKHDLVAHIGYFVLILAFFHRIIFLQEIMYVGDNLSLIIPAKIFIRDSLLHGHIPLWNPHIFSGVPFIGDINNGIFYPFNILYFFFSPLHALSYQVVIEIFLAGCFMYYYMRVTKFSYVTSFICGITYMFSGTLLQITQNTSALDVIIWIPLILALIEIYVQNKKASMLIFISIIMSIQIFAGHIQFVYYSMLLYIAYILFKIDTELKEKLFTLGYICIVSFLISSIQIIPFLEYTQFSTRPPHDISFASSGSTHPLSMIHLLLPNFFGIQKDGTSWGAQANIYGYIGIISLMLAIYIVFKRRDRNISFFFLTSLVAFLISLGKYSPLFYIAFYLVPFFSRFRAVSGILIIYTFCMVVLIGYGLEYIFKNKNTYSSKMFLAIGSITVVSFIARVVGKSPFFALLSYLNSNHLPFIHRFFTYAPLKQHTIFYLWTENLLATSLLLFIFISILYIRKHVRTQYFQSLICILIISDLFYFGQNTRMTTPDTFNYHSSALTFLRQNTSYERIYTLIDGAEKPPFGDSNYYLAEAYKTYGYFKPDMHIPASLYSIDGYASIVHKDYVRFITPSQKGIPTGIGVPELDKSSIDMLGTKYVVTGNKKYMDTLKNKFIHVYTYMDKDLKRLFYIYENKLVMPRIYAINGGKVVGKVKLIQYDKEKVVTNVSVPRTAQLILSDTYYPGWKAYMDNKEVKIMPYKDILRSITVPKGRQTVSYIYSPKSYTVGKYISLAGILFIILSIMYEQHTRIRKPLHIRKSKIKRNSK